MSSLLMSTKQKTMKTFFMIFLCCWGSVLLKGQSITSVTPNQNPVLGNTTLRVSISGSGTNFAVGSSTLTATGSNGTLYSSIDQSTLTNTSLEALIYIPCGVCGPVDLSLTTLLDGQMTYNNAFNITCPQLNPPQPNSATPGQTLTVGISGTNLNFTQGSNVWMYFYNSTNGQYIHPSQYTVANTDSVTINMTAPLNSCGGVYDIVLYPASNNSCPVFLDSAFSVNSNLGQITLVNPDTIQAGQTLPIGISGTGVNFNQGSLTVFFRNSATGVVYTPSSLPTVQSMDSLTINVAASNSICAGNYDVCVQATSNSCPICFDDGLYVASSANPPMITSVTTNPASSQGGQSLELTISGTNLNFSSGSSTFFYLSNNIRGYFVGTSSHTPNPLNPNETVARFNYVPQTCGTFDLFVNNQNTCNGTPLSYPNAVTINRTLNPELSYAVPVATPNPRQLRLSLAGTDIDFMQGSSTLSARLVHPTNGTILTAQSITPLTPSSVALVDFIVPNNVCGDFNLEILDVPTGCGGTTTVVYSRLLAVNSTNCHTPANFSPSGPTMASGNTHSQVLLEGEGAGETPTAEEANLLNQSDIHTALQVKVFPNPMQQQTNVLIQGKGEAAMTFVLYDLLGQVVQQKEVVVNESLTLQREQLPAGMYLYQVLDATGAPVHVGKLEMQ